MTEKARSAVGGSVPVSEMGGENGAILSGNEQIGSRVFPTLQVLSWAGYSLRALGGFWTALQ